MECGGTAAEVDGTCAMFVDGADRSRGGKFVEMEVFCCQAAWALTLTLQVQRILFRLVNTHYLLSIVHS